MITPGVRWMNAQTGEIKERPYGGVDADDWEWESSSLELALALVPDLEAANDAARKEGRSADVHVSWLSTEGVPVYVVREAQ